MTVSFEATENALVAELRTLNFLDEDNCRAGEADECFRHIAESNEKFLCITDYAGGRNAGGATWAHAVAVMFAIRVEDETQIEGDVRAVVAAFHGLMLPENRLGGVADAYIETAQPPISYLRNEVPFVYLFFTVEALQPMRGC